MSLQQLTIDKKRKRHLWISAFFFSAILILLGVGLRNSNTAEQPFQAFSSQTSDRSITISQYNTSRPRKLSQQQSGHKPALSKIEPTTSEKLPSKSQSPPSDLPNIYRAPLPSRTQIANTSHMRRLPAVSEETEDLSIPKLELDLPPLPEIPANSPSDITSKQIVQNPANPIDFTLEPPVPTATKKSPSQSSLLQPLIKRLPSLFQTSADNDEDRHTIELPLANTNPAENVSIESRNGRISLTARGAPLSAVLDLIAKDQEFNLILTDSIDRNITVALNDVALEDALNSILGATGHTWTKQHDIIVVSEISGGSSMSPATQGRDLLVLPLNFLAAADVKEVVQELLSPLGKIIISETDSKDRHKTQELIVVEDTPAYLTRIHSYIKQVDQAPRQVLIEAHVLEVTLEDNLRHGVNFDALMRIANADVSVGTVGLGNPLATPSFIFDIAGTDLTALVDALKDTADVKTLASPKVMVVNGQEAKIQIGSSFGYFLTTTTQTSTLQTIEFLDVGVILNVTPQITDDHQVLMYVRPVVSTGAINPISGLPEEDKAEVETTVLLPNGKGMIIGGLIQETDSDRQFKVPWLGDMWLIGRLFQRRTLERSRTEIIITIVPHIVPMGTSSHPSPRQEDFLQEQLEVERSTTRLLKGPLIRNSRPWEPSLPDASDRSPLDYRKDHLLPPAESFNYNSHTESPGR